jgi:hypothetical protein
MAEEERTPRLIRLCGIGRVEVILLESTFPITAAFCNCNSCRHMSGSLCFTSIPLPVEIHYQPDDELLAKLTTFEFSKGKISIACAQPVERICWPMSFQGSAMSSRVDGLQHAVPLIMLKAFINHATNT